MYEKFAGTLRLLWDSCSFFTFNSTEKKKNNKKIRKNNCVSPEMFDGSQLLDGRPGESVVHDEERV